MYADSTHERFFERKLEYAGIDDNGNIEKVCEDCEELVNVPPRKHICENCFGELI